MIHNTIFSIFFIVIIFLTFIVSFIAYWFIWKNRQKRYITIPPKAKTIFTFDLNQRKYSYKLGDKSTKKAIYDNQGNRRILISNLINHFDKNVQKLFFEAIRNLEKGSKKEKFTFMTNDTNFKNSRSQLTFSFHKYEDGTDYIFIAEYDRQRIYKQKISNNIKFLDKNSLINLKGEFKSFIAFGVEKDFQSNAKKIINLLSTVWPYKNLYFFQQKELLSIVLPTKNNAQSNDLIKKVIANIQKRLYKKGIKQFFHGSTKAVSKNVNSNQKINKIIETLLFLISISREEKRDFVSHKKILNKDMLSTFVETTKHFKKSEYEGNIKENFVYVKKFSNNRKIIEYIYPTIANINQKMYKYIISNIRNKEMITNAFADQVAFKKRMTKPVLIDVNKEWLIGNQERINYKKAVYVIHFNSKENLDQMMVAINNLKEKNIYCGLHLNDFNENISTVIEHASPRFIVIDSSLWNDRGLIPSSNFMKLISLNKLCLKKEITLIYQNPSRFLTKKRISEIGLVNYYEKL